MKLLLDTHIILWAFTDDDKLSGHARELIMSSENTVYYSLISEWEISIKHMLHPDEFLLSAGEFCDMCKASGFSELPLEEGHIFALESLTRKAGTKLHNDPFDRMLIAQAKAEGMRLITHDKMAGSYDEKCLIQV